MKASVVIERLQKMMLNKGDVEVVVLTGSGSKSIKLVDSANESYTGKGFIFIQSEKEDVVTKYERWRDFFNSASCNYDMKMRRCEICEFKSICDENWDKEV